MRADKRYYVNADRSKIVDEDDPQAAYLLAAEGDDITNEDVKRYGLNRKKADADEDAKAAEQPAEVKAQQPVEDKAQKAPAKKDDK